MNPLKRFFSKLYANPGLLWKIGFSVVFIFIALIVLLFPNATPGMNKDTRWFFSGMLGFYGFYRFITFYLQYRQDDEE